MTSKAFALGCGAALAVLVTASLSAAQPAPTARPPLPAAPTVTHGAPINGVCAISQNEIFNTSLLGKAVIQRLQMLGGQVTAELQPQATSLGAEQRALQQLGQGADPSRVAAFNLKATEFDKLKTQRQQEMEATQQKALQRFGQELQPVVAQVYQQRQCSILLDRDGSVFIVSPAMDVTQLAVTALNAKIQALTFDRERLEAGAPAPAPGR